MRGKRTLPTNMDLLRSSGFLFAVVMLVGVGEGILKSRERSALMILLDG